MAGGTDGVVGFQSTAMRFAFGTTSVNISNSLGTRSVRSIERPVMFPPGLARLTTWPMPTGSAWVAKTIGIVLVACRLPSRLNHGRGYCKDDIDFAAYKVCRELRQLLYSVRPTKFDCNVLAFDVPEIS